MAMSGTYVAEVPLKGSAEKHYKKWRNENHVFQDAVGHHIQGCTMHDDGKPEVFKEKREIDDEKMALTLKGLEGQAMEKYKKYEVIYQFIPKSKEGCVCKITLIWEKRNENSPEPINYMKFVKSLVADMDDHVLNGQNKA
ncbi:Polyketide cyclase/dehydrase and lipid transport superfamily protein [Arabidopsis thaliana]|uniref:Polyketide cyclase/dehydrase and lipid transport superfamily protein n=1 Tax=Arabidopsis thaliana TaxID=3702 RepID=F4HXW5_ARATH|nr:Polyketide cyclase/dehydrase and lipid transport superfamily protein [Arabidopsis thaliana]AEE29245.1 Polyketide cyclase/dehydrase and lipid transport superfamily protein [Arabidopsis thaliana]|eukprot:NP_001184997.1 Polyketide cyclase/dehydrase and lipid transport superfamily protein [Arabidopsis thaliana]